MEKIKIERMNCFIAHEYGNSYEDLKKLNDISLFDHFCSYGLKEGRQGRKIASRENFLKTVGTGKSCLEIGPFLSPVVHGKKVKYFDVLDRNGLIERAVKIGYPAGNIKEIDFVSKTGDLSIINQKFDEIISSHCIEHQPDLIQHLKSIEKILNVGGVYFLIIPDKRYCFDNLISESTIAEIVDAHHTRRSIHILRSVIEHRALTTHNDALRHWLGDHADVGLDTSIPMRLDAAVAEFQAANGGYIDVHAWQFTPDSFFSNITLLRDTNYISLEIKFVCNTPFGRNEFVAALIKR